MKPGGNQLLKAEFRKPLLLAPSATFLPALSFSKRVHDQVNACHPLKRRLLFVSCSWLDLRNHLADRKASAAAEIRNEVCVNPREDIVALVVSWLELSGLCGF